MKQTKQQRNFGASFVVIALVATSTANAGVLMNFNAANRSGAGAWSSSVGSEALTIGAGAVAVSTTDTDFAGTGKTASYVTFNGSSGFVSDVTPITAGLTQFTITAVVRVGANPGNGAGPDNQGFYYNMITGMEIGGAGQGEFQFGFSNTDTLNAATGLNNGSDDYSAGGTLTANNWATVAFVLTNTGPGNYSYQTYINGAAQGTATTGTLASGKAVANSPFGVGYNVDVISRRFLTGDIAMIRYDDVALDQSALTADAVNFAGLIPEPSGTALFAMGALGLLIRRRR